MTEEEDEEIVDPAYIEKIEAFYLQEIDWTKSMEDDLQTRTQPILVRIEQWLMCKRKKRSITYSVHRIHDSSSSPLVIIRSNKVVDSFDVGK